MTKTRIPVIQTVVGLRQYLAHLPPSAATPQAGVLGLVPTMGALHAGHLSLIQRARPENQVLMVSIFVNPLQFGPTEDLENYPRSLATDVATCEAAGVDVVFAPTVDALLGNSDMTQVMPPAALTQPLCGRSRPGHFQGVATIVTKLLSLIRPDRAYFGRKDAQQLAIIQRLVSDLNLGTTIVPCPIVREPSGLACSSRNQYLSPGHRQQAVALSQGLFLAQDRFNEGVVEGETLLKTVRDRLAAAADLDLEYVELVDPDTLTDLKTVESVGLLAIAARIGSTRLIDNVMLDNRRPILAIDGPAGAGKSTVTRLSAARLGLLYLDTGAMYRAMTWLVLQSGLNLEDELAIADLVAQADIQLEPGVQPTDPMTVWVNGQNVTQAIRSREVTAQVSAIAAQPAVRTVLKAQQQAYGKAGGVAMEGRDIGTHVFPDAGLKIFLTASIEERARRRFQELHALQNRPSYDTLVDEIAQRDRWDSERATAPLCKAADAIEVLTDGLTIEEVTDRIVHLYHERCPGQACAV